MHSVLKCIEVLKNIYNIFYHLHCRIKCTGCFACGGVAVLSSYEGGFQSPYHTKGSKDARFITDESITRTLSTISQSAPFIYSFTWMWSVNLKGHTNYLLLTLWELHILQFGHNMYYTNRVLQAWPFIGYNTKKTSGLMCKNQTFVGHRSYLLQ